MDVSKLRGILLVKRVPPHFLHLTLTIPDPEGIIDNLELYHGENSSLNIFKMGKQDGFWFLNYYIVLQRVENPVYLVSEQITLQHDSGGETGLRTLVLIQFHLTRKDLKFVYTSGIRLAVTEEGTF